MQLVINLKTFARRTRIQYFHWSQTINVYFQTNKRQSIATSSTSTWLHCTIQHSTDIWHISGEKNNVADMLSRSNEVRGEINLDKIADAQKIDVELKSIIDNSNQNSSLLMKLCPIFNFWKQLYCDASGPILRPFVTEKLRYSVIEKLHCLSHPSIKSTLKMVRKRYVWFNMHRDCSNFVKTCIQCQRSKVIWYTKSPTSTYVHLNERFEYINIDIIHRTNANVRRLLLLFNKQHQWLKWQLKSPPNA